MPEYQTICKTGDVPEGTARMFVVGDLQIGIFHINGEFFALDNRCPHAGASLAHGVVDGETVSCRIHHWRFRLRDGIRLDDACAKSVAQTFPVRIVEQDVQADLEQKPGSDVAFC